jgi:hypothetical protein
LYADYIKEYRKLYKGNYIYLSRSNVRIATSEGLSAVDEAIRFLLRQKPISPYCSSSGLAAAAGIWSKTRVHPVIPDIAAG